MLMIVYTNVTINFALCIAQKSNPKIALLASVITGSYVRLVSRFYAELPILK